MSSQSTSVLIVCLGNICRSPLGEAVLAHEAKQRGIDIKVDSAGTAAYHVGEDPDERSVATCKKYGVPISHEARKVSPDDFRNFTHILASDTMNLINLERMKPKDGTAIVRLWGSYEDDKPIEDPYYGGVAGFDDVYQQCLRYSRAFLDQLNAAPEKTNIGQSDHTYIIT
ncbi:putative LTP1-protein-tyrosine-phosphatase [Hysterangium stoloniferum]|nr:putative LTP1-protein-tyrosine-phosphatase [Hysterangium stoloniferum]